MAALVTLCKAYIGIERHFNLWSYFSKPSYNKTRMW
jgi:hypothetical protein